MITLVLGGTRSGKSRHAQALARALSQRPLYVATSRIWDAAHAERIVRHQRDRGPVDHVDLDLGAPQRGAIGHLLDQRLVVEELGWSVVGLRARELEQARDQSIEPVRVGQDVGQEALARLGVVGGAFGQELGCAADAGQR